jgi:hypothetical protein
MHSQEGWAHFAADAAIWTVLPHKAGVELPADSRTGNLRLYGSGYKPFDSLSSLRASPAAMGSRMVYNSPGAPLALHQGQQWERGHNGCGSRSESGSAAPPFKSTCG